jgi:hypothetical protein
MADAQHKQENPVKRPEKTPPAGPHAKERLTDRDKTPGTGALPDPVQERQPEADVGPG